MASKNLVEISDDLCTYLADEWDHLEQPAKNRILSDINAAVQEMAVLSHTHLRQQDCTLVANGPRNLTGCSFTSGSRAWASGSPAVSATMIGCGLRIEGDLFLNRIVSATELQGPALGSFTGLATVYGDGVVMPAHFISVLGPAWLNGVQRIEDIQNETDRLLLPLARTQCPISRVDPGDPCFYWLENRQTVKILRLWPVPAADCRISFKGEWGPETYSEAQLRQGAPGDDSGLDPIVPPVLANQHDLILLPIARKRFSSWIHFNSREAQGEIDLQYQRALQALNSMNPQREDGGGYAPAGRYAA